MLGLLGREQTADKYYSFMDLREALGELEAQANRAAAIEPGRRTRFQAAIMALGAVPLRRWRSPPRRQPVEFIAEPTPSIQNIS